MVSGTDIALCRRLCHRASGGLQIGPQTQRPTRHVCRDGLIVEVDERPDPALDDERRRYYRLTTLGQLVARAEAPRLTCRC